jgi:hypothetical protein
LLEQGPRAVLDFAAIEPVHFSGKANDFAAAQIVMKNALVGGDTLRAA